MDSNRPAASADSRASGLFAPIRRMAARFAFGRRSVSGGLLAGLGVAAVLALPSSAAAQPRVDRVTVSDGGSDGYFAFEETIRVTVRFDEDVDVTGTPRLEIEMQSGDVYADYQSGSGSRSLVFEYEVTEDDVDRRGFTIARDALDLNRGTIRAAGSTTVNAELRLNRTIGGDNVDGDDPDILEVDVVSDPGSDDIYGEGDIIRFAVEFDEDVFVDRRPSGLVLVFEMETGSGDAVYAEGDGTDTLIFEYEVEEDDFDDDGITVFDNELERARQITDAAGNEATGEFDGPSRFREHEVNGGLPGASAVDIEEVVITSTPSIDSTYRLGETIQVTVRFSDRVEVDLSDGRPSLDIAIGTRTRRARYASGSGSANLVFTYRVVSTDRDTNGVSIPRDAIDLNGGEIVDDENLAVDLRHISVSTNRNHRVNGSLPSVPGITALSVISRPASGITYALGETIQIGVSYSERVTVTGTPRLAIVIGTRVRTAEYIAGSGTSRLVFAYVVAPGDRDTNGVSVRANALTTSGATIQAGAGEDASNRHAALSDQSSHRVNAGRSGISSIAVTSRPRSGGTYGNGERIEITVTFNAVVTVVGSPQVTLTIGSARRQAAYRSGSGTRRLVFAYVVAPGDADANGLSIAANSVSEAGGFIRDGSGAAPVLTHAALADQSGHRVQGVDPPAATGTLAAVTAFVNGAPAVVDASTAFARGERYSASSSNTNVATTSVSGSQISVAPVAEGTATITVTATNAAGRAELSFEVTVTRDPAETEAVEDTLGAFGESMLSSARAVIGDRIRRPTSSTTDPAVLSYGGAHEDRFGAAGLFRGDGDRWYESPDVRRYDLFRGDRFEFTTGGLQGFGEQGGGTRLSLWGAGDVQYFDRDAASGSAYEGTMWTPYMGIDVGGRNWLVGFSGSYGFGDADFGVGRRDNQLDTELASVYQYTRISYGRGGSAWAILGAGWGDVTTSATVEGGEGEETDLRMLMAMVGIRQSLVQHGGIDVAIETDFGWVRLDTGDGESSIDNLRADRARTRVSLEGAYSVVSAGGTVFTTFAELAGRYDTEGGDGENDSGLDVAGGFRLAGPGSRVGLEARGRVLAIHSRENYREFAGHLAIRVSPAGDGTGFSMSLTPEWGGPGGGASALLESDSWRRLAAGDDAGPRASRWNARAGYGLEVGALPGVFTPFSEYRSYGADRGRLRMGVRYGGASAVSRRLSLQLAGERAEYGGVAPSHGLRLLGSLRF